MTRIDTRFSISLILALVIFMIIGSTTSMSYATPQTLPSCTDPTGQNLPCMMVISTLPPPPNALQCQETSGQLLPCSYATQNLSNGEQIVVITVYVPASYVFTGYGPWTIVKQVVHETKTRIVSVPNGHCERQDANANVDLDKNLTTKDCDLGDANEHGNIPGCEQPDSTAKTDLDKDLTTKDCDLGDANEHKAPCERPDANAIADLDKDLKTINCDLGDANEHGKSIPPPSCNSANYSGACLPTNNTKVAASRGSGTGSTCVNNCTTGTTPPVDCAKNPTDPSCTQTLTPPPAATTKTCPDGSVIDASASCPTPSTIPNTPPPPSSSPPPPPPSNNPGPPSSSNNGGVGSGGSGSGGGSSPSQPNTVS